jgi:hypothetical protein
MCIDPSKACYKAVPSCEIYLGRPRGPRNWCVTPGRIAGASRVFRIWRSIDEDEVELVNRVSFPSSITDVVCYYTTVQRNKLSLPLIILCNNCLRHVDSKQNCRAFTSLKNKIAWVIGEPLAESRRSLLAVHLDMAFLLPQSWSHTFFDFLHTGCAIEIG